MASPALYWHARVFGNIGHVYEVLPGAKKLLQTQGLTDIKQGAADVSGRTPNTHAAIGFVKFGNTVTAVVMVAGTVGTETKQVCKKLSDAIDKWAVA